MALTADERRAYNKEYARRWRAENRDRDRENGRRHYAANREREQEKARRREAENRENTPDYTRIKRHRGLQPEDLGRMFEMQQGRCYLCGDLLPAERRKWHIDHDHRCCPQPGRSCRYCRRGLACHHCNVVIGMALDDPGRLRRVADNLETAMADVTRRFADKAVQGALFERAAVESIAHAIAKVRDP